ncbi:MAG: Acyl carrier protein [Firmicutes bacterium]|nr:Acyl carrier protein [Bacillota bacterium]
MDISERVRQVIIDKLSVKEEMVVPGASFKGDLNADSLDLVEVVMGLEEAFSISIPEGDMDKISTVQDALDYISAKLA